LFSRPRGGAQVLAIVGVVSLLLAFGTPLYAVLFYGIPGVNQLHTPFRWVYPFSLCVAVLAGLGGGRLGRSVEQMDTWKPAPTPGSAVGAGFQHPIPARVAANLPRFLGLGAVLAG